jgi:hypothetical protein
MKGWLYPLRQDVTPNDIARHLKEFEDNGMLFTWVEDQKKYGFFLNWFKHQSIREAKRHKRKTSAPPEEGLTKYKARFELPPPATDCQQLPENPFPNPYLNPNPNPKENQSPPSATPIFQQIKDRYKTLWPKESLTDKQIGLLIGTKKRRRNVYGFGFPEALLECLSQITPEYAKEIRMPFVYLKSIAGNPASAEKYKKEGWRKMKMAKTQIGAIMDEMR